MIKGLLAHWRGEQGFLRTCVLNGIGGFLLAIIASFIFAILVIPIDVLLVKIHAPITTIPLIIVIGIPFLVYIIWNCVGMLRYGLRVSGFQNTFVDRIGEVVAILLVVTFVGGFIAKAPYLSKLSLISSTTVSQREVSEMKHQGLITQITNCWDVPPNLTAAQQIPVEVILEVNRDHSIREARIVDQARLSSDKDFRVIVESALQALKKSECRFLDLPDIGYNDWKEIDFTFDPKQNPNLKTPAPP